ncbi:hypothetical protein NM688_g4152 [Phlebia brevispora]|uniref:Uncharacterized protein n=1 Tax=Phlebia brevispora TaxID=194682 RepID=A0ACC1T3Q5_9APHY|nr:hypothetical protein NM688_g4152 [Phlebia brevispora]
MFFTKHFHRQEAPWEVIDSKTVNPIPMWDEDEGAPKPDEGQGHRWSDRSAAELDVVRMHNTNIHFKFVHDLRHVTDLRRAVQHARYQLMQEAVRRNYNIMLLEGWHLTIMRKGKMYRVEVVYSGRPAYAMGKIAALPPPPFMGVLDHCQKELHHHMPTQ